VNHQRIMPRTTIDIDAPILRDLKRRQKREGKSLGRLVSDLLAEALHRRKDERGASSTFRWIARSMRAQIDLADKETIYKVLDGDAGGRTTHR
jgi:hypothetical protein